MASAEQPPKKRKHYDAFSEPRNPSPHQSFASPPPPSPAPPPPPPVAPPPPPPSQEEILRKRRNREEIRNLYECYRRITFCVAQKDPRLMPDLEQAYLSLITASRGCTSVQRIVAELIPRYASYCPTALEAAVKVSINMYNWSLAIIMRGEDVDGVAFQTAKACIFGLVDICCTASYEAPTSSVIRGICNAVFLNVLSFFTSTFEDKDIYQLGSKEILKLQEPMEFFYQLKQEQIDDTEPALHKLFELRALSLLCIFFSFPKNLLAACFELFVSGKTDVVIHQRGQYLLRQVTRHLNVDEMNHDSEKTIDGTSLCADSADPGSNCNAKPVANESTVPEKSLQQSNSSFMEMAINRDPSLRSWILLRYKKISESLTQQAISEVSFSLEKVLGSLSEQVRELDYEENDEDSFDPSKYMNHPYLIHKIQNDSHVDVSKRGLSWRVNEASILDALPKNNDSAEKSAGQNVKPLHSVFPHEINIQSVNENSANEGERVAPASPLETRSHEDVCLEKISAVKESTANQFLCSGIRKQLALQNDGSREETHVGNQSLDIDLGMPANLSAPGVEAGILPSPKQNLVVQNHVSNQYLLHYDGDPAAMDVFSASKQLWLGPLGRDASETLVRLQFEDFGPLENFSFFSGKDFALLEYRNMLDAVKAREYMQGSSLWGGCLHIKFLDQGLGSRVVNGIAVGDSCHVYIGKVSTQWAKDEIMHELMAVGLRNHHVVTDLASEHGLLLEFGTKEEAAHAIAHIRYLRRESGSHMYPNKRLTLNACTGDKFVSGCQLSVRQIDASVPDVELINAFSRFGDVIGWHFDRPRGSCCIDFRSYEAADLAKSHLHGARFGPTTIHVEFRKDSCTDSSRTRISQLSSLFSSLCAKYKINQSTSFSDSHKLKKCYPSAMRDEKPTSTLWIGLPDISSPIFTDDDLMALCNLAAGNVGSVVGLTWAGMQNSSWFVEFSSVDAAATALKNIRNCPGIFLQTEFRNTNVGFYHDERQPTPRKLNASGYFLSQGELCSAGLEGKSGNPCAGPFTIKPDSGIHELVSPRVNVEKLGAQVQSGQAFQSNWTVTDTLEVGSRKIDDFGSSVPMDLSFAGPSTSHAGEQIWQYKKQEIEPQILAQGSLPCPPMASHGVSMIPPPIRTSSFVRPFYHTPSNSWDNSARNALNQISAGMMPNDNRHVNARPAVPFIPSSITPLSQLPGGPIQRFDQMVTVPGLPSVAPPLPSAPDVPPPLPFSPPPLPLSQPPSIPPPPSSPPPHQLSAELSKMQTGMPCLRHQWQGTLSKSGVHYCTVYATREDSVACKYSNALSEPADWPSRLDVTKRTDFRHVKATFANTPPNKREVCRLLPSSSGDHKGVHDFISYLKQRECAGVIKIPAGKSMWARLLFILPYSVDTCSLLAISTHPSVCLIALVLPKETNSE